MYNVINRAAAVTVISLLGLSAAVSITSCDSAARREKAQCDSLVNVARQFVAENRYPEAFAAMDSVDSLFPQQIEARQEVTRMRAQAMIDYSQQQLILTDSLITVLSPKADALSPKMNHYPGDDDIAGYYVAKAMDNPKFTTTATGIQARVDDEDLSFYLLASNNQRHIGIVALEFATPQGTVTSASIPASSERSGDADPNGIDLATFVPADLAEVINRLSSSTPTPIALTLIGKNGERKQLSLTAAEVQALLDTYEFADVISRLQHAKWMHDKYERQLIIARDHNVNL